MSSSLCAAETLRRLTSVVGLLCLLSPGAFAQGGANTGAGAGQNAQQQAGPNAGAKGTGGAAPANPLAANPGAGQTESTGTTGGNDGGAPTNPAGKSPTELAKAAGLPSATGDGATYSHINHVELQYPMGSRDYIVDPYGRDFHTPATANAPGYDTYVIYSVDVRVPSGSKWEVKNDGTVVFGDPNTHNTTVVTKDPEGAVTITTATNGHAESQTVTPPPIREVYRPYSVSFNVTPDGHVYLHNVSGGPSVYYQVAGGKVTWYLLVKGADGKEALQPAHLTTGPDGKDVLEAGAAPPAPPAPPPSQVPKTNDAKNKSGVAPAAPKANTGDVQSSDVTPSTTTNATAAPPAAVAGGPNVQQQGAANSSVATAIEAGGKEVRAAALKAGATTVQADAAQSAFVGNATTHVADNTVLHDQYWAGGVAFVASVVASINGATADQTLAIDAAAYIAAGNVQAAAQGPQVMAGEPNGQQQVAGAAKGSQTALNPTSPANQTPIQNTGGGTPFPPDLNVPDLIQRLAVQRWLENMVNSIPKEYPIDPDVAREHGITQQEIWMDSNEDEIGLPQVEALVLIQLVASYQLGNAADTARQIENLSDDAKQDLIAQLRTLAVVVRDKYKTYQDLQDELSAEVRRFQQFPDQTSYSKYMHIQSKIADLEGQIKNGVDVAANQSEIAKLKAALSSNLYQQFLDARDAYNQALIATNPLLNVQLSDGGRPFWMVVLDNRLGVDGLVKALNDYAAAMKNQSQAQRVRIDKKLTTRQLWELGAPQYAQIRAKAAAMYGPAAKRLMDMIEANYNGAKAVGDYNVAVENFILAIAQTLPGIGQAVSVIQIIKSGDDYIVAIGNEQDAKELAPVAGYQGVIQAIEQTDSAGNSFLINLALTAPQIPGFIDSLRTGKNIKVVTAAKLGKPGANATAKTAEAGVVNKAANAASEAKTATSGAAATVGKEAAAEGIWAPGRQIPADPVLQQRMLNSFIDKQAGQVGVGEVSHEIQLAQKAGMSDAEILEITQTYSAKGLPTGNMQVAQDLMVARLKRLGYDVSMAPGEFRQIQAISVRAGSKGAGLTAQDVAFLQSKLQANPKYLDELSKRGIVTEFGNATLTQEFETANGGQQIGGIGRGTPTEGFIPSLQGADEVQAIKNALRWSDATAASSTLKGFEDAVRNGVPAADLKAQAMALKIDPQAMRSLKNAPNDVRTAFNAAEKLVYDQHDAAVIAHVRGVTTDVHGNPTPWAKEGVQIRVDDFRTPGSPSTGVNTDRDFRVLYNDPQKGWIEVPKEYWQDVSTKAFADASGYTPDALRQIASPQDLAAWQNWDPAQHGGETVQEAMMDKWKELHQQLGTDKFHPEASVEFSDQGLLNGERAQVANNIKAVKNGEALLQDPEGFGMMYHEKTDAYLRLKSSLHPAGDKLEAMAQLNKGIDMLNDVRAGYVKYFGSKGLTSPLAELPENFQEAAKAIQKLGPFDKTITAGQIATVEEKLRDLGFAGPLKQGDPFKGFAQSLDGQFEAFKTIPPTGAVSGSTSAANAAAATGNTAGVSGTSMSAASRAAAGSASAVNTGSNTSPNPHGTSPAAGTLKILPNGMLQVTPPNSSVTYPGVFNSDDGSIRLFLPGTNLSATSPPNPAFTAPPANLGGANWTTGPDGAVIYTLPISGLPGQAGQPFKNGLTFITVGGDSASGGGTGLPGTPPESRGMAWSQINQVIPKKKPLAVPSASVESAETAPVPPPNPTGGGTSINLGGATYSGPQLGSFLLNATNTGLDAVVASINQYIAMSLSASLSPPSSYPTQPTMRLAPRDSDSRLASTTHRGGESLQLAALDGRDPLLTFSSRGLRRLLAEEEPQAGAFGKLTYSLVANGNSSGQALELQVFDPAGRIEDAELPEGLVLEPLKQGSAKPVAEIERRANILRKPLVAYCVEYLKLPPEAGMLYRLAPQAVQNKFSGIRWVLQAGRELAAAGKLHPDNKNEQAYIDSIRQYSLWAEIEHWDQQKFGEVFLEKTRENAAKVNVKWTPQMEEAFKNLVPGRWRDIQMVRDEAARLASAAQAWVSP